MAAIAQWGQNCLPNSVMTDLSHPSQIKAAAQHVTPEDVDAAVRISADLGQHVKWLQLELARGFDRLYLHEVGPDQERFVETFGREVLPPPSLTVCDHGRTMAALGAKERAKLPDSSFAYVDSGKHRLLPIHDEAHVRNALARFNRVVFEDEGSRDRARSRLLKAARKHGIVPVGFIEGQLRPKLPTGQLTLLFADIENSSRLVADLGDAYRPALSTARRIERTAVRRSGGFEVDARADEFFAVFEQGADALEAAIGIQRAFAAQAWPTGASVKVRIGVHSGRPTLVDGGYQGISVNAGARLCSCGHGGQILLSRTTHAAVREAATVEFRHLGTYRLRGIPDEHEIYQVIAPDLLDGFPALRIEG